MSTKLDAVVAYFKARPGVWIDGEEFRSVGGRYEYRSRIAEARTLRGMHIENRVRRVPGRDYRVSEYRYLPPAEPSQSVLSFGSKDEAA